MSEEIQLREATNNTKRNLMSFLSQVKADALKSGDLNNGRVFTEDLKSGDEAKQALLKVSHRLAQ